MKPSDPVVPENDGLEGMTVEVRRDEAGGCVVDIGGSEAVAALERRAYALGVSPADLVATYVRRGLDSSTCAAPPMVHQHTQGSR